MLKIDFKVLYKEFYAPKKGAFAQVTVPKLKYLMIDGMGNPNSSPEYVSAIEALYATAYTMKFYSKIELKKDFVVAPLEGLWWADDMSSFTAGDKDAWKWTMMILVPDWLTASDLRKCIMTARSKKPDLRIDELRIETYKEGLCVQTLHVGPYSDEGPVIAKMHDEYFPLHGLVPTGMHHEIYLSDPRRTAPEKLKTIIRQPVTKK